MLGHELTHIRNGDVRMMVIAVIIAGVVSFFVELVFRLWFYNGFSFRGFARRRAPRRRRGRRDPDRRRPPGRRLCAVLRHPAGFVALARIPRRCRLGGAHQESRRHDLGAAQDRGPRRIARRDLRGDGNVHRQSARRLWRVVRHPSERRQPRRGPGQIRRRPRSGPDRAAAADEHEQRRPTNRASRTLAGPWGSAETAAPPAAIARTVPSGTTEDVRRCRPVVGARRPSTARNQPSGPVDPDRPAPDLGDRTAAIELAAARS